MNNLDPALIQLTIAFVVMVSALAAIVYAMKNAQNRIAITGIDFDSGRVTRRMCRVNKDGNAIWKGPHSTGCELVLEKEGALQGKKGLEYFADVSHGQGVLMSIASATMALRMTGWRLYEASLRAGLKEIAAASGSNLERMLMMVLVAIGVLAIVVIGGVIYLVQTLNVTPAGSGAAVSGGVVG